MTVGRIMLVGGLAGAAVFLVLFVVVAATAGRSRRKLLEKIRREL